MITGITPVRLGGAATLDAPILVIPGPQWLIVHSGKKGLGVLESEGGDSIVLQSAHGLGVEILSLLREVGGRIDDGGLSRAQGLMLLAELVEMGYPGCTCGISISWKQRAGARDRSSLGKACKTEGDEVQSELHCYSRTLEV